MLVGSTYQRCVSCGWNMYKKIFGVVVLVLLLVGCKVEAEEKIAVFSWGDPIPTTYQTIYQSVDFTFEEEKPAGLNTAQVEKIKEVLKGKDVWLLAGDPSWSAAEMQTAAKLATEAGFLGLVLDCEPWVNEGWDKAAFTAAIKETTEKTDLPIMVCIPFWLDSQEIVDAADGIVVMLYLVGQENLAKPIIDECKKEGKSVMMALELQPPNGDVKKENTYNGDVEAAIKAWKPYQDRCGLALHYLQILK